MSSTRLAGLEESVPGDRELLLTPLLDIDVEGSDVSSVQDADHLPIAGGSLYFEEDSEGGLGRHLGLYSTTLLM